MSKNVLITGGAGFIGSNFIEYLLKHTSFFITNVDALTYAANIKSLHTFNTYPNYRFFHCNINNEEELSKVFDLQYDVIINFAAESHVDRSIENAHVFLDTNVKGTLNLLYKLLAGKAKKMIHISTDEVYGSLEEVEQPFTEVSPLKPNNPYAASKASADHLVHSFYNTYELPLIITRCSNNYGPNQYPEKFIPKVILHALEERKIPLYGDGKHIRDWLFVKDHCRAIFQVMEHGKLGEVYNIGGGHERRNIEVIKLILDYLDKSHQLIEHVADRKGHDRRYAINWGKIQHELRWQPEVSFYDGLVETIEWYKVNYSKIQL